jgi:hypothetical protein
VVTDEPPSGFVPSEAGAANETGTHGYPGGTDGYPFSGEDTASRNETDEPFWRRLGFGSFQEYIDHVEELAVKYQPGARGVTEDPPAVSVPAVELADLPEGTRRGRVRQVGIKLSRAQFEDLVRAASLYGVRPSTMARLLVNRGVGAVLDRDEDPG